jgi:hypothetical protein
MPNNICSQCRHSDFLLRYSFVFSVGLGAAAMATDKGRESSSAPKIKVCLLSVLWYLNFQTDDARSQVNYTTKQRRIRASGRLYKWTCSLAGRPAHRAFPHNSGGDVHQFVSALTQIPSGSSSSQQCTSTASSAIKDHKNGVNLFVSLIARCKSHFCTKTYCDGSLLFRTTLNHHLKLQDHVCAYHQSKYL